MKTSGNPTIVFPGFLKPRNLKWRAMKETAESKALVSMMGGEQFRQTYVSSVERLRVIVAWHPGQGWHLSISHPTRYPVWDEIRDARYDLLPDACTMAMMLPPKAEYVAIHPNCFHLHEVYDP